MLPRHLVAAVRCYSGSTKRWKQRLHAYGYGNSFTSLETFSKTLLDNVLYNEGGLVIINKPYGVGVQDPSKTPTKTPLPENALNTAGCGNNDFYLNTVLPQISEALGYPRLTVLKAPERYTSGIAMLSADDDVASRVRKSLMKSRSRQHLPYSYLVVVLGCPNPAVLSQKVGLKLETSPVDGSKKPVILNKWSQKAVSRNEVLPVKVEHTTLHTSRLASLVEVRLSKVKWHFLRVYMAYLVSPILGDHLYGSRVQNVLGVPISVNPFSTVARQSQSLSKEILAVLDLRHGEEVIVPAHIHLHQLMLLDYNGKGKHLEVQAPIQEAFLWTCKQLGLDKTLQMSALSCGST